MNKTTALARGNVYRLLSQAYLHPSDDFFGMVQSGEFVDELNASITTLAGKNDIDLRHSADLMAEELSGVARNSISELRSRYYGVFGHTISKVCPPYETLYGMPHIFQQTQELGDIAGFYRAFGLETKSIERLDHISVELEFMYFLCYKHAYAMEKKHGKEKVAICVEAQKKFLQQHLGRWVFAFTKLLKKNEDSGFYRRLAELTESFLSFELAHLDVKPKELGASELTPMPSMYEDSGFSCSNDSAELGLRGHPPLDP